MIKEESAKIGLVLVILTEIMFFAGLLSSYWILRESVHPWPPVGQPRLPVGTTAVNTALFLASLWTMNIAVRSFREAGIKKVSTFLGITALLGIAFLGLQGFEWVRLIQFGLTTALNVYGGTFYMIVGMHGLHVVVALLLLFFVLWRLRRIERGNAGTLLALCRIYWFFVVLLWPVIYVALYLL